jgi:hypothetical protein
MGIDQQWDVPLGRDAVSTPCKEATMTQLDTELNTNLRSSNGSRERGEIVDMKLEVIVLPVSDVDRAKRFYLALGFRLDADYVAGEDFRVVQLTPPGSECSIIIGNGITAAVPGSV